MGKNIKPYDDPYAFLAFYLISISNKSDLQRILEDDDYVYRMVRKETREQDLAGHFVDAIVEEILTNKKRMGLMSALDVVADYLCEELDLERLRKKISEQCKKYNIL